MDLKWSSIQNQFRALPQLLRLHPKSNELDLSLTRRQRRATFFSPRTLILRLLYFVASSCQKRTHSIFIIFTFLVSSAQAAEQAFLVQQVQLEQKVKIISVKALNGSTKNIHALGTIPEYLAEGGGSSISKFSEIIYPESQLPTAAKVFLQKKLTMTRLTGLPNTEVRTLVNQGPSTNRIDLTIIGDGYTLAQKNDFFADAEKLANNLFVEKTFSVYLPLFNVHAVFVPSKESGITDTVKRDTALGLYRSPANSKRAIMPGNTMAIDQAIALAPDTDFPILLANDNYYGGLGGRYAITTRADVSGPIVLRHELGHNFGSVGEEYDGGQVYSGANFSPSIKTTWSHWIKGNTSVFESMHLSGDYVWQNLQGKPYKAKFNMPPGDYFFEAMISSVGWSSDRDINVFLDGKRVDITGRYTKDRSFFKLAQMPQLSAGEHNMEIEDANGDGDNVLAFNVLYAHPKDIITDRSFIGAYSVFNDSDTKMGYRPTFNACLMRDMEFGELCAVDKENIWIRFLQKVSLIDSIQQNEQNGKVLIRANVPALAGLKFNWYQINGSGQENLIESSSQPQLIIEKSPKSSYKLVVEFTTPEVRKPGVRFLTAKKFSL